MQVIDKAVLDEIIENLFYVLPIIHKKLLKIDTAGFPGFNLSHLHIGIMGITRDEGPLPISEIASRLLIPRPQMTLLIDQLVRNGLVERLAHDRDRRMCDITLTEKGRSTLYQCDLLLAANIREKLSHLEKGDLLDLSTSLRKLKDIGKRWERKKREKDGIQ